MIAGIHRSGKIQFFKTKSEFYKSDTINLGLNVGTKIKTAIEVTARLSRSNNKDIFVPGVPEAKDNDMALNEIEYFAQVIKWKLSPKKTRGEWPKRAFESCTDPNTFFKYNK